MPFASDSVRHRLGLRHLSVPLLALAVLLPACHRRTPGAPATAQIHGRVLTANGRALPGAVAAVERESAAGKVEVARAALGPNGDFTLANLPPGRYRVRTEAPGYATVTVPVELGPGDSVTTSLRFEPEQLLEGVVQDARGKPLADALVLAWPMGKRQGTLLEAHSGPDGRFTLAGLPRGTWTLLAEAPGFGTMQLDRVDVPARPLTLRLEGESRTFGGVVLSNGQPVADARVALGGPSVRVPRITTTDKKGTFQFGGIGQGKYTLRASYQKLSSIPINQLIDDGTGWLAPFRLPIEPGGFVEGRVLDDTGRPLAGAPVEVLATPSDDLPEATKSGPTGQFTVGPLPPGRYQILARVPDHVMIDSPELRVRPDATQTIELRLARAGRLFGRVVDEHGQPLPGVSLTAAPIVAGRSKGNEDLTVLTGVLPLAAEAAGLPAQALTRQGKVRTATTDAQGRFSIDEMTPGAIRLDLAHPDRLPLRREPIQLGAGQRQELGDLVLQGGAVIAGRVLDESSLPIEGARIEARPKAKGPPLRMATDRDGRFSLRVPPGDYALIAIAPSRAPQSIFALQAVAGSQAPPLELRLPRADGAVEGQVRETNGRAVSRVPVVALAAPVNTTVSAGAPWRPRSNAELGPKSPFLVLATTTTDSLGRFRIKGLPRGLVILEARPAEWPPAAVVAQVGESAALTLARPGGIDGEVREKGTGSFVGRYEIDVIGPQGRRPERVDKQGAGFSILGLAPGPWTLKVKAPGYAPAELPVEVPAGSSRKEASLRGLRIELNRDGGGTP